MNIVRFLQTIRHLKFIQIRSRVIYTIQRRLMESGYLLKRFDKDGCFKQAELNFDFQNSPIKEFDIKFILQNNFEYFNIEKSFATEIDWNRPDLNEGTRLWKINLHIAEYIIPLAKRFAEQNENLNLEYIKKNISSWISQNPLGNNGFYKDSWNSYVVSLRLINWIKAYIIISPFLDSDFEHKWKQSILNQAVFLNSFLEIDLQGNHLLENAFGLIWASSFLGNSEMKSFSKKLLKEQLQEQILDDGAHFELSPMYHAILLARLFDCINLLQSTFKKDEYLDYLKGVASKMLGWLNKIIGSNTNIPLLNDSALNNSPTKEQLNKYGESLGINSNPINLSLSGYRVLEKKNYFLIMDVGNIGPDYIPGHAHADTFSFLLFQNGLPIITDTGTSTYDPGPLRNIERSTFSHNTVCVNDENSSNVWASFRVANRAKIILLEETESKILAQHDGYKSLGIIHERSFLFKNNEIVITDILKGSNQYKSNACIHFHPDISVSINDTILQVQNIKIEFENSQDFYIEDYYYSSEFNKRTLSKKVVIKFNKKLITKIKIAA